MVGVGGFRRLGAWLGPTPSASSGQAFAAEGAAKMGHPRRVSCSTFVDLCSQPPAGFLLNHHAWVLRALRVSSLMVQSISLWGCAVLGKGVGNSIRLALSPNKQRQYS